MISEENNNVVLVKKSTQEKWERKGKLTHCPLSTTSIASIDLCTLDTDPHNDGRDFQTRFPIYFNKRI